MKPGLNLFKDPQEPCIYDSPTGLAVIRLDWATICRFCWPCIRNIVRYITSTLSLFTVNFKIHSKLWFRKTHLRDTPRTCWREIHRIWLICSVALVTAGYHWVALRKSVANSPTHGAGHSLTPTHGAGHSLTHAHTHTHTLRKASKHCE